MTSSFPVVLVEFFATWCPHCQRMAPIVDEIRREVTGKAEVTQIDIDQNQELTQEMDIQGTPTFLLYKNGELVWRQSGEMPETMLLNVIDQAVGK